MAKWWNNDDDLDGDVFYGGDIDTSVTETVVYGSKTSKTVKGSSNSYGGDMYINGDKVSKKKKK